MAEEVLGKVAIELDLKDSKFTKNLQGTKTAFRSAMTEMRANMTAMDAAGNKYGALAAKQQGLTKMLEVQANQMKLLEKQYQGSITKSGEWTRATAKYAQQYNTASAKVSQLNQQLVANARQMAIVRTETMGVTGALNKFGNAASSAGSKLTSVGKTATATLTAPIAAGFTYGAKKAIEFDNVMNTTKNLIRNGGESAKETSEGIKAMTDNAEKYSNKYGISQKQIADGYQDLVKRGYTSKQALGAMNSELKASIATGDEFSDVTTVASQTLESFGLKANSTKTMTRNTNKVLNELSYAADATSTGFSDLGIGMSYVGSTAHQAGFSLAETASAMGVLSNAGLEADKAGTGLRQVINSLTKAVGNIDSKKSVLRKLGISKDELVDSSGKLKDLSTVMGVIQKHTEGMTKVERGAIFNSLFGTTGQQAGLILAESNKQLGELTTKVKDATSNDYIGKLAESNLKSAQNQLRIFKEQLTNTAMSASRVILPYVTDFMKHAENVIEAFDNLGDGTKKFIVNSALAAAALGPLSLMLGGILKTIGGLSQGVVKVTSFFRAWQAGKAAMETASLATTTATTAMSGVTAGAEVMAGSVAKSAGAFALMNPYVLGVAAALGIGVTAYELWGKKAIESADRTKRWGADIGASADESATKFKNWSTKATVALSDTSSSAKTNGKQIEKAFAGMAKSAEEASKKQRKAADDFAKSIGGAAGEAIEAEAEKEEKSRGKSINKINSYYKQVQAITKQARDKNVALTQDQRNQIANLQTKMAQEQVKVLGLTSKQQRLVLKAELNQTNSMTQTQLKAMTDATSKAMYKEVDTYNRKYGEIKNSTVLSAKEKNAALEALEYEHVNTLNSLGNGFINAEKARGYSRKAILEDMVNGTGMTMAEAKRAYAAYEDAVRKTDATIIKLTGDMSKNVRSAAEDWNAMVLDPKTGKLKTNAQDEVNKAVNSKDKWNEIQLLEKKGVLSTNAEQMVAAALIANGRWDKMSWKEQKAWLKDGFSETVVKALEETGDWNNLTLEQKEAIVKADNKKELANLLLETGQWNNLALKEQEAVIQDKATKPIYEIMRRTGEWDKLDLKQKEAIINAKGKAELVSALVAAGQWNNLAVKQQQALISTKGGAELIDSLSNMKRWNELEPKAQTAIINAKGGNELNQAITEYKLWEGLPVEVLKTMVAEDKASGNLNAAKQALDNWMRANPGQAKVAEGIDLASGPLNRAKGSTDNFRNSGTGGPKVAKGIDNASSALYNATGAVRGFSGASTGGTKHARAVDNASGPANAASSAVENFSRKRSHTVTLTTWWKNIYEKVEKITHHKRGTAYHPGGLMMVNDAVGNHFRELVQFPDGRSFIPAGRNVVLDAPRGTKVLTANRTAQKFPGLRQYAEGTIQAPRLTADMRFLKASSLVQVNPSPNVTVNQTATDVSKLEEQVGQMINLMSQLLAKNQIINLDGRKVGQAIDNYQTRGINLEGRGVYSGT